MIKVKVALILAGFSNLILKVRMAPALAARNTIVTKSSEGASEQIRNQLLPLYLYSWNISTGQQVN